MMTGLAQDSRGIMEPYGDLIAIGFCMLGFAVFLGGFSHALQVYLDQRFLLEQHRAGLDLAQALLSDPKLIQNDKPGLISLPKLQQLSQDPLRSEFLRSYPRKFRLELRAQQLDQPLVVGMAELNPQLNLSLPVRLWLDPARTVPALLEIAIGR